MILEEMDLTEAEKAAFWPVYQSYANAIQYLDMEYIRLLTYAEEETLTEKKSAALTESLLMNELLLAKTRKQYFRKFRKALTAAQAGRGCSGNEWYKDGSIRDDLARLHDTGGRRHRVQNAPVP